jgi:hypothetical protein
MISEIRPQNSRGRATFAVLKAAVRFGVISNLPGCLPFKAMLDEFEFPAPKRREFAPTADQVAAARRAAHQAGAPSRAPTYALQFDTGLRQWDVIGQWGRLSPVTPSGCRRRYTIATS